MSHEYYQEVVNDLEKLFITEIGYDVIIYVGENENIKEFHAHSPILCTRLQYFCAAFSNKWAEKKDGKFIFKKPNIPPQIFNIILRFIYCGKIDLTKLQGLDALELLIAVDELNIQTLIPCIQKYLNEHKDEFLYQNPIEIFEMVYQCELFTDLYNYYFEKICEEPDIIFNSENFVTIKEPLLELLLKRDDLNLDETIIWDSLIKWGLTQNPSIQQDFKKWDEEEINMMKKTLHRCIPLVRFHHMSQEDLHDKVFPLKTLLLKDVYNSLLTPNLKTNIIILPPRQSKSIYDSIIIDRKHFTTFASWIDRKDDSFYNLKNIPYKFKLLYRRSRDGNTSKAFHEKCDNIESTIVIAKITNTEQIVGGYNPLFWDKSENFKSTKDSFIFSFIDKNDYQSVKLGYPDENEYLSSIYCNENYGPTFGGGHDLFCQNDGTWASYRAYSYPRMFPPLVTFDVEDYEVFQVIK
ncbi:hypothetical protein GLOIN_2v1837917 [Rhizophagus irregularis DAOM 181602=DAOM 197198]|uniref:Kelch-like protein 17 n=2 Tax=Rhizophagus irregularis TaxID=588596 RepID=A0A015L9N1_RHIIW|nr:hypothetical protein GLOIN_2v1837917 [Rhizophagus irregularis DAOM 181602=DAOM 197198]EXX69231.1 hypothetical protein RirG_097970 [Rhizophagus irregularis DAOM 197198w]POG76881.1 hypothetical protein GLOIN_2v1837917 [Rhizophagus irregularis DAOM 181602=DAOM 197198]|eukprot:XP_025183747.1 hypothetical protein GLOIN_2v1837917 [Rhizophagus irregularis DAOM 181602=DAOM 197198]